MHFNLTIQHYDGKGVMLVEFWFLWKRFIIRLRWLKVAHMIAVI